MGRARAWLQAINELFYEVVRLLMLIKSDTKKRK
ncbi:hypothetical protein M2281_002348 [Mesorhizobium soli]|nr:hypothetical protein [Mesorhizobium soli]